MKLRIRDYLGVGLIQSEEHIMFICKIRSDIEASVLIRMFDVCSQRR